MRSWQLVFILLLVVLTVPSHCGRRSVDQHEVEDSDAHRQQLSSSGSATAAAATEGVTSSRGLRSAATAAAVTATQIIASKQQPQPWCANGTRRCGSSTCLSLTDPAACGPACTRCPKPAANGVATCSQKGVCGVSCAKGYEPAAAAGQSAECRACGANTFKAVAGPGPCSRCPAGTFTREPSSSAGQQPSAAVHDEAADCVAPAVSCPPGQQADAASASGCAVCPAHTHKDQEGPGPCLACPPSTLAPGPAAEDHDSPDDCWPIMCPPGTQRNLTAGGCSVCPPDTFKDVAGSNPCSRCPAGTYTNPIGNSPADHDQQSDCFQITTDKTCEPGTQLDLEKGRCTVCPANTIKAGTNTDRCQPCPDGSRTFGDTASDHNEPSDCFAGGLIASTGNTGASAEALLDFEEELEWARNNTGVKKNPPRPPKKTKKPKKACLYACDGVPDDDTAFSAKVAHIAGSPAVYFMNDPSLVRSGVNLVSAVRDQRSCGTCVSHALASAAESAAAAAMRVDARGFAISHTFSYFCANYYPQVKGGARSCGTGWEFEQALDAMEAAPAAFVMNTSCLGGIDPAVTQLPEARLKAFCTSDVPVACRAAGFTCDHIALSDGLFQIQQHIRLYGSVVTSISITKSFISFFKSNPTGVFLGSAGVNSTADQSDEKSFAHAVQLIGYNNEELFWLVKNSYGADWGDKGFFKIAYGAAGVGHPEDTFALVDCFTTSKDPATVTAWSDRWPVTADELPGCVLYNATARDTISGIADHFQVEILPFVNDNTERQVIPTLMLGEPPRPEPQLQPNTSWAGTVFRVCGIPSDIYNRVAADPCTTDAKHCNSRQTRCAAGRCVCPERYAGRFCETDNGIQRNFSLPNGQGYVLHLEPRLNWTAAQQRCERDGMRLARLYSREHAIEVYKQVKQVTNGEFWIGLNDRRQEGSFAWVGGNSSRDASEIPLDFKMWFPDGPQPDNYDGIEDCVQVWTPQVLPDRQVFDAWNDGQCVWPSAFLCGPARESSDPCVRFPCSSGGTRPTVGCKAAAKNSSSNSVSGRVCLCDAGLSYVSDELGCVEPPVFDVYEFQLNGVAHALFLSPQASWTQADGYCRDRGMNLVKITREDYAQQLHEIVKAKLIDRGVSTRYWIGLNDRAAEGQFVWSSDGTSLAQSGYQRWAKNEPTNTMPEGEDCVWVYFSSFWNDGACGTLTYFVCSKI